MRARKLLIILALMLCRASRAEAQTLDEVYKRALTEGGTLNFYATLAQVNAATILPAFEKRFPGIKVNHVDATSDQLAARIIAESRGGKIIADIFQTLLDGMMRVQSQGLFLEKLYPEAAAFPEELKGTTWVATDLIYIVPAWNTSKIKKEEEPKQFEDFAEPRWKNILIAEPRDFQLLLGLAKHKYKSDEKAVALLKRIAANNLEFHKGHSQLVELLVAGQAAACLTCYTHHFPVRKRKGAPIDYMLTEGTGDIDATAIMKNARIPILLYFLPGGLPVKKGRRFTLKAAACRRTQRSNRSKKLARRRSTRWVSRTSRTIPSTKSFGRKSLVCGK